MACLDAPFSEAFDAGRRHERFLLHPRQMRGRGAHAADKDMIRPPAAAIFGFAARYGIHFWRETCLYLPTQ